MKRILVLTLLAGCAPVIQSATPESVSIAYDAPMERARIAALAGKACAGMGKQAGEELSDMSINPAYSLSRDLGRRVAVYECR